MPLIRENARDFLRPAAEVDQLFLWLRRELKGKLLAGTEAALQVMPDQQDYTMEARIPWASLGDYRPKRGDHIRWSMIVDFDTPDGTGLHHNVKWTIGWHVDPSTWGVGQFLWTAAVPGAQPRTTSQKKGRRRP